MDECMVRARVLYLVLSPFLVSVREGVRSGYPVTPGTLGLVERLMPLAPGLMEALRSGECDPGLVRAVEEALEGTTLRSRYEVLLGEVVGSGLRGAAVDDDEELVDLATVVNEIYERVRGGMGGAG